MGVIVNLDEFSELCGVTSETMRTYVRGADGDEPWLIERGDRGRGYKIEAEGGVAWWKARRAAEESASAEHQARLQQLRTDHLGNAAGSPEALTMSGRQQREEYAAVLARIKLRRMTGELLERGEIELQLANAAVELRRQLQLVPGEFAAQAGVTFDEVKPLAALIERAVNAFVAAIEVPPVPGAARA